MFAGFDALLGHIIKIEEQNKQILALLTTQQNKLPNVASHMPDNLPVALPLQSEDDVGQIEQYLSNSGHMNLMVSTGKFASTCVITKLFSVFIFVYTRWTRMCRKNKQNIKAAALR